MSEKLEKNSNAKGVNLLDRTFRFNHTWNEICTKKNLARYQNFDEMAH